MGAQDFHGKPFDEGTLTKLEIFELYAREWIPVFLSAKSLPVDRLRIFDFFAGPGTDSHGTFGSPLRLLRQLKDYTHHPNWGKVRASAHLFDEDEGKVTQLIANIRSHGLTLAGLEIDVRSLSFNAAFHSSLSALKDRAAAKLLYLDQFGVAHVTREIFCS